MKKVVVGIIGTLVLVIVACGNVTNQQECCEEQVVKQEQKKRAFQLPQVPAMLQTPELRVKYVAEHYWDHFDFRDTVYIHLPDITEQAAVNYMDLLCQVSPEVAKNSLKCLVGKASVEPLMMDYMWKTFFRYWHEPNSPFKNEDMFILFCQGVEQTQAVKVAMREKASFLRVMAEKNRIGQPAVDFVYTLASGKQGKMYGLKAEYTLMFFYDPDCHACSDIKQAMKQAAWLKEKVTAGQVKVLTIYPDEDVNLWRNRLGEMDAAWVNGYDKGRVLTLEQRYDLSSIPSFYLLDKDKKVVLKDVNWSDVVHFFENK